MTDKNFALPEHRVFNIMYLYKLYSWTLKYEDGNHF